MSALLFLPIENGAYENKGDPDIDPYYIYALGKYCQDISFLVYHFNKKLGMIGLKSKKTADISLFDSFKKKILIDFFELDEDLKIKEKLISLKINNILLPSHYQSSPSDLKKKIVEKLEKLKRMHQINYTFSDTLHQNLLKSRFVKKKYEIERIRKACQISSEGVLHMLKERKNNPSQYNSTFKMISLAKEYVEKCNLSEWEKYAYPPIFTRGKVEIHPKTEIDYSWKEEEEEPQLLLLDFGIRYKNFCADITRTFTHNGKWTSEQEQIYEIVLDLYKTGLSMVKPGVFFYDIDRAVKEQLRIYLIRLNKVDSKLSLSEQKEIVNTYMPHSLGHTVGIQVHDVETNQFRLEEGCVITIEPGIYYDNIGIRIEDTVLVTKTGYEILSNQIPVEREDISKLCLNNMKTDIEKTSTIESHSSLLGGRITYKKRYRKNKTKK